MGMLQDYLNSPQYGLGLPYVAPDGTVYQFNNGRGGGQSGYDNYTPATEMYNYTLGQQDPGMPFQATNLATGKTDTRAFQDPTPASDWMIPLTAVVGGLAMGGGLGAGAGAAGPGEAGWGMDLGMGGGASFGPGEAGWGMDLGGAGGAFGPGEAGWGMDLGGAGSGMGDTSIEQMFRDASAAGAGGGGSSGGSFLQRLLGGGGSGGLGSLLGGGGGGLLQLLGGALGLGAGQKGTDLVNKLLERSDPFYSQRAGYQQKLADMFADPKGSVGKMPGYQAGLDAVERKMASQGFNGSGNMETSLLDYGGTMWNQQAQFLSQLGGAQFAPANNTGLANIAGQANATTTNSWANLLKGGLGMLPNIMSNFGSGGGGSDAFSY